MIIFLFSSLIFKWTTFPSYDNGLRRSFISNGVRFNGNERCLSWIKPGVYNLANFNGYIMWNNFVSILNKGFKFKFASRRAQKTNTKPNWSSRQGVLALWATVETYCMLFRYLFIFDSKAVHRNLRYKKVDNLFTFMQISYFCPGSQKNQHFNKQGV